MQILTQNNYFYGLTTISLIEEDLTLLLGECTTPLLLKHLDLSLQVQLTQDMVVLSVPTIRSVSLYCVAYFL